jgi:hypothetical protein
MDWNKLIDQRLSMSLEELAVTLALEFIKEGLHIPERGVSLTIKTIAPEEFICSDEDRVRNYGGAFFDLIYDGSLLNKVQLFGDKQKLHDLIEARHAIIISANLDFENSQFNSIGQPYPDQTNELIALSGKVKSLFRHAKELKVNPSDVVRWMNSVHEGQELLPTSLRDYLDGMTGDVASPTSENIPAVEKQRDSVSNDIQNKQTAEFVASPSKTKPGISAAALAKLADVTERTVFNWDAGKNAPDGYPGRKNKINATIWAHDYVLTRSSNQAVRNIKRANWRPCEDGDVCDGDVDKSLRESYGDTIYKNRS